MRDSDRGPNQPSPASERLDEFVRKRLNQISERLPQGPEPPAEETIREVQFLRELTQLAANSKTSVSARKRSFLLPALIATAIVISVLVLVPLTTIRVDLDLLCSGVRFRTAASRVELIGLSAMSLLEANELAPITVEDPETLVSWRVDGPIELRPDKTASVTLGTVVVPESSSVALFASANAGTWRLEIEHEDASIDAMVRGRVQVAGSSFERRFAFGRGSSIQVRATEASPHRLGVFLTPEPVATSLTSGVIPVAEIVFEEMVQSGSPGGAGIIRGDTSSTIEGNIINVSLGGRQLPLNKRDALQLSIARGYLRELRLEETGIRLSLTADATEVLVGRAGVLQSLRPSWLEWLAQRHTLALTWGSALWLFPLLMGVMKWWRDADA